MSIFVKKSLCSIYISLKLTYRGEALIGAELDGRKIR